MNTSTTQKSQTSLGNTSPVPIKEATSKNSSHKFSLNFSYPPLGEEGAMKLLKALKTNKSSAFLLNDKVEDEKVEDKKVEAPTKSPKTLKFPDFSNIHMTEEKQKAFLEALKKNSYLTPREDEKVEESTKPLIIGKSFTDIIMAQGAATFSEALEKK